MTSGIDGGIHSSLGVNLRVHPGKVLGRLRRTTGFLWTNISLLYQWQERIMCWGSHVGPGDRGLQGGPASLITLDQPWRGVEVPGPAEMHKHGLSAVTSDRI